MSELQQLEKLQKIIRELKSLKVIDIPIDFENEARKISKEQIFMAGQMNLLMRMGKIIN